MRKGMMIAAVGSVAMLQVCSVGAVDTEALESNGLKVNYGFVMDVPGAALSADYNMEVSPEQAEKMSVTASIKDGEEVIDLNLSDLMIVDKENIYLNLKAGKDAVESVAGDIGADEMLDMFGLSGDWVSLPIPAFEKLGIKFDTEHMGQVPEVSEELLTDLMNLVSPFAPTENDGVVTVKIDNASIIAAAEQADVLFAEHKDEILKIGTPSFDSADAFKDLNLVAPFEKYIGAVAAGMAEATGMEEADCVSQINELIEMVTAEIVDSFSTSYSVNDMEITPEMLEETGIAEAVKEALEGQDILIQLSYDDNSAEFVFRVDPAETIILDAAVQEDGTLGLELKDNEDTVATGTASFTAEGCKAVLANGSGEELSAEIKLTENGVEAVLTTPDGEQMTASAEVKDGLVLSLAVPGTAFTLSATGKGTEMGGEGELKLDIVSGEETGVLKAYLTYEVPETPVTIEIPVATDGLAVIKNVAAMIFASSSEE